MANIGIEQPIIVKKIKKGGHGHHGGAWKVAYADFVTAMMAFFLLLWLLNATTEEQKMGIADYFSPASVSDPNSGSGGVLGGVTVSVDGAKVSAGGPSDGGATLPVPPTSTPRSSSESDAPPTEVPSEDSTTKEVSKETVDQLLARREQEQFEAAADALRQAIESVPELEALQKSLLIDQTPEGMRIQLIDQSGLTMFASGSAEPNEHLVRLIGLVSQVITRLPNKISVSGHTDSQPFRGGNGYTNWELSSDRANAARRLLIGASLDQGRISNVQGRAATEPLLPDDPTNASNRRISIVLLRENTAPAPAPIEGTSEPAFRDERALQAPQAPLPSSPAARRVDAGAPVEDARALHISR